MSDTRYPTRMHEILGVEPYEVFEIKGCGSKYRINELGYMDWINENGAWETAYRSTYYAVYEAINNGIIRKHSLTNEQKRYLKALLSLGFKWIETHNDQVNPTVWANYDPATQTYQNDYQVLTYRIYRVLRDVLDASQSPLNIEQALKDAGVEVEE